MTGRQVHAAYRAWESQINWIPEFMYLLAHPWPRGGLWSFLIKQEGDCGMIFVRAKELECLKLWVLWTCLCVTRVLGVVFSLLQSLTFQWNWPCSEFHQCQCRRKKRLRLFRWASVLQAKAFGRHRNLKTQGLVAAFYLPWHYSHAASGGTTRITSLPFYARLLWQRVYLSFKNLSELSHNLSCSLTSPRLLLINC